MISGLFIVLGVAFLCGCQKEEDYEQEVTSSLELREFIIAAADLKHSLTIFEEELSKVDFTKLDTVIDSDGRITIPLSSSIGDLDIERKLMYANKTKEALMNKYPQLTTTDMDKFAACIDRCIQQSTRVSDFLLEKDIDVYQPMTKVITGEVYFSNSEELKSFLSLWVLAPGYVEVIIYTFTDGTMLVIQDSMNTSDYATAPYTKIGDNCFYGGKQIAGVTHTHNHNSSSSPSMEDYATKWSMPNCWHSIFYGKTFYPY